jgi:uncharacterized protein YjbJ (UPF0337 family)
MVWNETEGRWHEFVGEIMKRWARLTDNDVVECRGNRDILIGKLQQLYGMSIDEAGQQIGELERKVNQAEQGAERHYGGDKR